MSHKNNGNLVRYLAVALVCVQHGFMLAGQPDPLGGHTYMWIGQIGVLIFFALSGYLLAGKITHENLYLFIANRVARIFPLLILANVLTVALGAAYFNGTLTEYLKGDAFGLILNNLTSYGQGAIPGVAIGPVSAHGFNQTLNIAQWSIFYEMRAYAFLVLLFVLGVTANRAAFNTLLVVLVIFGSSTNSVLHWGDGRAYDVTMMFLLGVFIRNEGFNFKSGHLLLALAAGVLAFTLVPEKIYWHTVFICCLAVASVAASFGKIPVLSAVAKLPDVTYGIFLLHWPIGLLLSDYGVTGAPQIAGLSFALAAVVSYPIHVLLEEPARLLPRRIYKARFSPAVQAGASQPVS